MNPHFFSHPPHPYLKDAALSRHVETYQAALDRCLKRLFDQRSKIGLRNPKIGRDNYHWHYCGADDWVQGFYAGQLWLAYSLSGDASFANLARARWQTFAHILKNPTWLDHDLGFQFSLSAVADWKMTANPSAKEMGIIAATALRNRFNDAGQYIPAWNSAFQNIKRNQLAAGRIIADSMENMPLLFWAYEETGQASFKDVACAHANTLARHLIRSDFSSFHTYTFDLVTGDPLSGTTHQGFQDDSCWARGQAWLIHGFAQTFSYTGEKCYFEIAKALAQKAEALLGNDVIPLWDYCLPKEEPQHRDSSASAITAAGLYTLAIQSPSQEEAMWATSLGDRLLNGLLAEADLTKKERAQGFLDKGAAHVPQGFYRNMLPYGDYFFMEALMRSLGHQIFFW